MEIHHHPGVAKKGLKAYFLEGLMIFLAVFLGFIAENIREHIADKTKEKEYIHSMLRDLEQDSARLNEVMQATSSLGEGQDSLINLLSDSIHVDGFSDKAYRLFFRYATSLAIFNSTDRAITQLTSSGNFRLINDQEVADSISSYYDKVKNAGSQEALNSVASNDCFQFAQNLFNFRYGFHPDATHRQLLTQDPVTVIKYINKLTQMRISQQYYSMVDLKELENSCTHLIHFLKRSYRIS